jgi:CubicO group peptidase (beta-lactamase class C family)
LLRRRSEKLMRRQSEKGSGGKRHRAKVFGVAVVDRYDIAWSRVIGGPPDRLFQAGSISKPVTALAALELAARGLADLDADVNDLLTSWRLPGPGPITLRKLLGHTSGLGVPYFPGYARGGDVPTLGQVLDGVPPAVTKPVRSDPARHDTFRYSGGGYAVVQQLIADITGQSFARAARCLVLEPLGMTASTFEQPLPAELCPAAAREDWHVYPESAAAGLWTTPADLARFVCALQAPPTPPTPGREAVTWMLTPRTTLPAKGEWNLLQLLGLRPPDSFGLGMFLHGTDRFSHVGGASGFFAALTGSTQDGSGAVVMTAWNASPFPFRLLRAIGAEQGWTGFRQDGWRRLRGLPVLRNLT